MPSFSDDIWGSTFSIADIQNPWINFGLRHKAVIEPSKEATGYQHAWVLKFVWGVAILKISANFS